MKSDCIPTIKLEIRPMVLSMVQHMGIQHSELADVIEKSVEYEIEKQVRDIPNMVKDEVSRLMEECIDRYCNEYARDWMSPDWVKKNKEMVTNFKNTIRTEVMIAIDKNIQENKKPQPHKDKK